MANGTITMDKDDWAHIESIVNAAVEPLKERLEVLRCEEHHTSIVTLEAQRDAGKEQKKDTKESKDWLLKIVLAVVTILGALQAIGFFRSLAK